MPEWCAKAAQALLDKFEMGTASFSIFDDDMDFISTTVEEIAGIIWREYQAALNTTSAINQNRPK